MGTNKRPFPLKLADKLLLIRENKGFSQEEILKVVAPWHTRNQRAVISDYERGKRQPSFIELLNYARLAGVLADDLIDDKKELRLDK